MTVQSGALAGLCLAMLLASADAQCRPYPGISGLAATADSAATAGNNPAGSTRFSQTALEGELMWFSSESTWESGIQGSGDPSTSQSSGDTLVPRLFYVQPLGDKYAFSFTILGAGFSDDLGQWAGRYFVQEYDSLFVSALPSLAYRVNDKWSVAGSVAITYASYEQERAVANIFDPGFGDGRSRIETDSIEMGFGVSALYEPGLQTRWGASYASEIDATQEGGNKLSGLGPRTAEVIERLGISNAKLEVESTSPQSLFLGVYHEFANRHAVTLDAAWIDFSEFRLSEFYFNGEAFLETETDFNDIYALAASYTWPLSDRWMLGVGGLATSQMIDDEDRSMTLRLDAVWSLGVAAEWQWKPDYRIKASFSYMDFGDAPVTTESIPGIGSFKGEYSDRATYLFQLSLKYGGD